MVGAMTKYTSLDVSTSPLVARASVSCGGHGHSMRLEGLDATNNNALSRAIVVHAAWYVNERVIGDFGMLGRSQGCFAVADSSLPEIMARLGPGSLIYAGKA
jgi:hypothetical protein